MSAVRSTSADPTRRVAAPWFWVGIVLVICSWAIAWSGRTEMAHHSFFPLWLGYILTVDGFTRLRTGTSMFARSRPGFGMLFVASIPLWWLFEAFNARLQNWSYVLPHPYGWFAYHAEASLAFSTVVPAIFVTSELIRHWSWIDRTGHWIVLAPGQRGWRWVSVLGALITAAVVVWPDLLFPLVWIGVFVLVDPLVKAIGGRSIASQVEHGWWGTVWVLFTATLICGFFWEMWNSRAMPKWTYDIPYAGWLRIFEMPILGFGGYLPFGLETYALVMLLDRLLRLFPPGFICFDRGPGE